MNRAAVAIIGAGPAGCATGIALATAGVDVVVFDRASFPRDKTCGDAISNDAVALLDELGCGEGLRRGPHALVHAADARFPDGSYVRRRYEAPGMIVPRVVLDDLMRRRLEEAGARVVEGRSMRLVSRGGRVVGVQGAGVDLRTEVVVAADGHGSVAWPLIGRPEAGSVELGLAIRAYFEGVAFPDGDDVSEHCFLPELPSGYAWIFPSVDGRTNVGIYQRADRAGRGSLRPLLDAFVEARPDRFAGATLVGRTKTWPLPLTSRPGRASAPGLLAVGDAAKLIDPLTGEGIWQAIFSGLLAAETIRGALNGGGLTRSRRWAYELKLQRRLALAGVARARIQELLSGLVDAELYRRPSVLRALRWGYGGGILDVTKS